MSNFDPYKHFNVTLNPDGSLTRFLKTPRSEATGDTGQVPGQTVISKDLILDATKNTCLRIYRPAKIPSNDQSIAKLPILLFFHASGWIIFSIADTMVHESCNNLSDDIPAVVVSVGYRLAPENKLPAQYEDAVDAINWVKKQGLDKNGEQWLREYGDFSRCYLYGVSSGANIAFNAALRVLDMNLKPLTIGGLILSQPFFGGKHRTKSELKLAADEYFPLPAQDMLWELALPAGIDRDHRFCNPLKDVTIKEKIRSIGRCLVIGFGGDPLIDRQQEFVQMLVLQGVLVEARFDDVGFHLIDFIDNRRAAAIRNFIKEFI